MSRNLASVHILGVSKSDVISIMCPSVDTPIQVRDLSPEEEKAIYYLKRILGDDFISVFKKQSFEFAYLTQPYISIKNKNYYSIFAPRFDLNSLEGWVEDFFDYEGAPLVIGFGTDFESVVRIFIFKNRKVVADICFCFDLTKIPEVVDASDYDFKYLNLEVFEEIFEFSVESLKKTIYQNNDFDVLCQELSSLFGLPFNITYDEVSSNIKKYNAEYLAHRNKTGDCEEGPIRGRFCD